MQIHQLEIKTLCFLRKDQKGTIGQIRRRKGNEKKQKKRAIIKKDIKNVTVTCY